ncbi:MAG: fatty acid desaturase [Rubellimicrobium sp.]|nr:fatty acid desaturase [Rubellimicrobium sp.]
MSALSDPAQDRQSSSDVEWPTLAVIALCYAAWLLGLFALPHLSLWMAIALLTPALALHSSLTHEAIHGHPTPHAWLNALLLVLPLTLFVPYLRFRDLHLAHHHDEVLTDPYDDPESNYLDPAVWKGMSRPVQLLLQVNNTLAGRILLGPFIGIATFLARDLRAIRAGEAGVLRAWVLHLPPLVLTLAIVALSPLPMAAFLIAVWGAFGILKIRTFLEHRAHERARGRTVVIEDRGPLAFLFLNNNLHVVHHMHPRVAWYRLPALYRARPDHYLARNDGYRYRSYAQVFRAHFLRAKDPVPHPLRPG